MPDSDQIRQRREVERERFNFWRNVIRCRVAAANQTIRSVKPLGLKCRLTADCRIKKAQTDTPQHIATQPHII